MVCCQKAFLIVFFFALCTACPDTWTNVNDAKCIKLFPRAVDHEEAVTACQAQGAQLMRVHDKAEWDIVEKVASGGGYREMWTDDAREPFFGNPNEWCGLHYARRGGATCSVYSVEWDEVKLCTGYCSKEYPFACQKPFTAQRQPTSPPVTGYWCPAGSTSWDKHCYKFLAGKHSWPIECSNSFEKDDLKPQSLSEETFIRNKVQELGYGNDVSIWIKASCNRTTCSFGDGKPTFHDKVNLDGCDDMSYVYWNLTTDEWKCIPRKNSGSRFYSVCKTNGKRLQGVEITVGVDEPRIQVETTDASPKASIYLNLWQILFDFI
ncbi:hypothetical protein HDE_06073 [Halotydeus destructor]|nr:hypothetical protein HDE_06073 [Halotydeus destructor]